MSVLKENGLRHFWSQISAKLNEKVDKIGGKDLSTNDFTNEYKTKLDSIESGAQVNTQSDWQQNDETANDYVKNRPGGYDVLTEILPEKTLNFTDSNYLTLTNCPPIEVGKIYIVTFDGTDYELVGREDSEDYGYIYIGNETYDWGGTDTGEPFLIYSQDNSTPTIYISSSETLPCTHTVKIEKVNIFKIPEKYLDIKNTNIVNGSNTGSLRTVGSTEESSEYKIGSYAFTEGVNTKASGYASHAEGEETIVSGECSHAEGYSTKASGENSHAEGYHTTASGSSSHAEGISTTASGNYSHIEGQSTNLFSNVVTATNPTDDDIITAWMGSKKFSLAKGDSAHVEGINSLALGSSSHAEGSAAQALGYASHSEGYLTKASAPNSHAEGSNTVASSYASHAEGEHTKASSNYQHVQGKYNIEDTVTNYADIIGNGKSDTERSNAATVDWQGNAWYAGDVYVGSTSGTNKDEGSKKLATEEYINTQIGDINTALDSIIEMQNSLIGGN